MTLCKGPSQESQLNKETAWVLEKDSSFNRQRGGTSWEMLDELRHDALPPSFHQSIDDNTTGPEIITSHGLRETG